MGEVEGSLFGRDVLTSGVWSKVGPSNTTKEQSGNLLSIIIIWIPSTILKTICKPKSESIHVRPIPLAHISMHLPNLINVTYAF